MLKQSQTGEGAAALWFSTGKRSGMSAAPGRRPWERGLPRGLSGVDSALGLHATGAHPAHGSLLRTPYAVGARVGECVSIQNRMRWGSWATSCAKLHHAKYWFGQLPMGLGQPWLCARNTMTRRFSVYGKHQGRAAAVASCIGRYTRTIETSIYMVASVSTTGNLDRLGSPTTELSSGWVSTPENRT